MGVVALLLVAAAVDDAHDVIYGHGLRQHKTFTGPLRLVLGCREDEVKLRLQAALHEACRATL